MLRLNGALHRRDVATPADLPWPEVIDGTTAIDHGQADVEADVRRAAIIPQARALNTLKFAATGTYAFIGGTQAEAKLTDAVTGQLLGEGVDRRMGGGSIKAAAQWEWGDAENVMSDWATQVTERLYSWTSGAVRPS